MWLFSNKKNKSDEELTALFFETGNMMHLGSLFDKYVKTVYGVCLFYFRDQQTAKDAVMQIFEKLTIELRKSEVKNFKVWLSCVVRNYCISELRKRKGKYFLPETYLEFEVTECNIQEEEKAALVTNEKLERYLRETLPMLKDQQRQCVEAFYLKSLSYEDISKTYGYSVNEVKSYIQNGKRNLKIWISEKVSKNENE